VPTTKPDYPHRHLYSKHDHSDDYFLNSGEFIIPLAVEEPTDPAELAAFVPFVTVKAHAAVLHRTVEFDTTKDGAPPQIVSPESGGAFTLIGGTIRLMAPQINSNCLTKTWTVKGKYTYAVGGAVSLALETGLVMQSLPIPTETTLFLQQQYGGGQAPNDLVISEAGTDVRAAYTEAQQIGFQQDYYSYWADTLFPGQFFNQSLLVGDTIFGNGETLPSEPPEDFGVATGG
jgi:hypothetical protein